MAAIFYLFLLFITLEYVGVVKFIPALKVLHLSTILGLGLFVFAVLKNGTTEILKQKQTRILGIFVLFTLGTVLYALVKKRAYEESQVHMAWFFMYVAGYYIIDNREKLHKFLVWFIVCHMFMVFINLDKLTAGGPRVGRFRTGYFMVDGNDFAWGLVVVLPIAFYFFRQYKGVIKRFFSTFGMAVILFGIIGTSSRGASVALAAAAVYYALATEKKVLKMAVLTVFTILAFYIVPGEYKERIHSITEYSQDSSATTRIAAWKSAVNMAIDYPIGVGAGNFSSAYGRFYRDRYIDLDNWGSGRWISPHSIYFSVLGEYGFGGLILLLYLLYYNFQQNGAIRKMLEERKKDLDFEELLPFHLNMSLIAYAVGGIFLGGITYPHLYLLNVLIARNNEILRSEYEPVQEEEHRD